MEPRWQLVADRIRDEATDDWDDQVAVDRLTGKVTSDMDVPVSGATVLIRELGLSAATTAAGTYTITLPSKLPTSPVTIVARAIGYTPATKVALVTRSVRDDAATKNAARAMDTP